MSKIKIITEKSEKTGKHYWKLVGANGETLAVSETYESKQGRDHTVSLLTEYGFEVENKDNEE